MAKDTNNRTTERERLDKFRESQQKNENNQRNSDKSTTDHLRPPPNPHRNRTPEDET